MPTNLNKIYFTCRLVNCETNVKKFVSENGDIPNICLNQSGLVVILHKRHL